MQQKVNKNLEDIIANIKIDINNYVDTIYAIIGFAHIYLFDVSTHSLRKNVRAFQGRRLSSVSKISAGNLEEKEVTPDLGIVINNNKAIIGEVKKNFPKDDERALKIFRQLKQYDKSLTGWNTESQTIQSHEIVLLVHQTTSNNAIEYYNKPTNNFNFTLPFSIIEFCQMNMVHEVFFAITCLGNPSEIGSPALKSGVSIPMRILTTEYSLVKLYDTLPPIPYLAELIWVNVVTPKASDDSRFGVLKKNQKLPITMHIDDIVNSLCDGFCFNSWHKGYSKRQPKVPRTDWVKDACKFMVACGDAGWEKESNEKVVDFYFQRHENIHDHFITKYAFIEMAKKSEPMFPGFDKL
jgi:hypothetical protein